MAIARKPVSKTMAIVADQAAEQFIASAGKQSPPAPAVVQEENSRVPAMIRFDAALLARVDRAAKHRGVSRSAWVQYTLSRALDEDGAA
jgi:hypothetical protein